MTLEEHKKAFDARFSQVVGSFRDGDERNYAFLPLKAPTAEMVDILVCYPIIGMSDVGLDEAIEDWVTGMNTMLGDKQQVIWWRTAPESDTQVDFEKKKRLWKVYSRVGCK